MIMMMMIDCDDDDYDDDCDDNDVGLPDLALSVSIEHWVTALTRSARRHTHQLDMPHLEIAFKHNLENIASIQTWVK